MNDNRGAKDLTIFVAGVLMCAAGLYLFLSNVSVQTHFWGGGVHFFGIIGGAGIPSGLVTVPFIIGIVMLFFAPESIWSKIVTVLGMLVILLAIIESTTLKFEQTNAFIYLMMVILIFGGFAMVMRILLFGSYEEKNEKKENRNIEKATKKEASVDEMLEEMKKKNR